MAYEVDRFFQRGQNSSLPSVGIERGLTSRLLNCRISNGSIKPSYRWSQVRTNHVEGLVNFQPLDPLARRGGGTFNFNITTNLSWEDLFCFGKYQGGRAVENVFGRFIVMVFGGVVFQYDIDTCEICPIFGPDPCFDATCRRMCLETVGGWVAIANWPNLPVLVGPGGARYSNPNNNEVGAVRLLTVSGGRLYVVSGFNDLIVSDPFSGSNSFAPLTFEETFLPGPFYNDAYKIGSTLSPDYIVGLCPLPLRDAAAQEFNGNLIVAHSASGDKFFIDTTSPRSTWLDSNNAFIRNGPAGPTMASCRSCTQSEYESLYISSTGRIRTLSTDQESASGIIETYLDDPLGRFDTEEKGWPIEQDYEELAHEISPIERFRSRIYAGVSPTSVIGINFKGERVIDYADQALAIGSLDSTTAFGERTPLSWEGFNTEVRPKDLFRFGDEELFCLSWENGKNVLKKLDFNSFSTRPSRVYTRSYFFNDNVREIQPTDCAIFVTNNTEKLHIELAYCIGDRWVNWGAMSIDGCCDQVRLPVRFGQPLERCAGVGSTLQLRITVATGFFDIDEIRVEAQVKQTDDTRSLGECASERFVCIEDREI